MIEVSFSPLCWQNFHKKTKEFFFITMLIKLKLDVSIENVNIRRVRYNRYILGAS